MRIVFIGTVAFSQKALEKLIAIGAEVVGVCTLEQSSFNADYCDLSELSNANGIPCTYVSNINGEDTLSWMADKNPDVIFCFGWSRLLKKPLLELAPIGVVGYHPAALPANRGRHPLVWALALGLEETASTFFFMDEGADSGDILSQKSIKIDAHDDAASLYSKVIETALSQIEVFVRQLASRDYPCLVQDHSQANVWRKRGRADGQIDWRMSAKTINNLVRALTKPYVGAHFVYRGQDIKVWRTDVVDDAPVNIEPGKVLSQTSDGVIVKCGEQAVCLRELVPGVTLAVGEYL